MTNRHFLSLPFYYVSGMFVPFKVVQIIIFTQQNMSAIPIISVIKVDVLQPTLDAHLNLKMQMIMPQNGFPLHCP